MAARRLDKERRWRKTAWSSPQAPGWKGKESLKREEEKGERGTSGEKSVKDPSQEPGSFVSVYWKRGRKRGEKAL